MKKMTQQEWLAEAVKRFGNDPKNWKVQCPACGTVQTIQDFIKAGVSKTEISLVFAANCIGRYTGQRDAGIIAHHEGKPWDKGCNWTLAGLLRIHTLEVTMDEGDPRPTFDLPAT